MAALVTPAAELLHMERREWEQLDAQAVEAEICAAAHRLLQTPEGGRAKALGLTVPGLANPAQGLWVEASFSGIRQLPLAQNLSRRFGLPVWLDNDAQASALAEQRFGGGKDLRDFLYVTVSNGVGGAIVANGALYYGGHGHAGEIGHVVVEPNGRRCKCGSAGCLERYAAGPGLVQTYLEQGGAPPADGEKLNGEEIARRADKGDAAALEAFAQEGLYLGRAIGGACNLLNPQKVIVGGGLALAWRHYSQALHCTVANSTYGTASTGLVVEPTALQYNGGLLGAAAVALRGLEGKNPA